MKTLFLILVFTAACKTVGGSSIPAVVTASVDCALPSLWAGVTVTDVDLNVASALKQEDPLGALALVAQSVGEAEVTCVAAKRNGSAPLSVPPPALDGGAALAKLDTDKPVSVLQQWLDREAANGLLVRNFGTLSP